MKLDLAIIIPTLIITVQGGGQRLPKKPQPPKDRSPLDSETYSKIKENVFIQEPEKSTLRGYRYYTFNGLYYRTPHCNPSIASYKGKSLDNAITHCIEKVESCRGLNYCENGKEVQFLAVVMSPKGDGMKEAVAYDQDCKHISINFMPRKRTGTGNAAHANQIKRQISANGYSAPAQ